MDEQVKTEVRRGMHKALDIMIDEVYDNLQQHNMCLWTEALDQYERKSFISIAFGQPADAIIEFMKQGAAGSLERVERKRNNEGDPNT